MGFCPSVLYSQIELNHECVKGSFRILDFSSYSEHLNKRKPIIRSQLPPFHRFHFWNFSDDVRHSLDLLDSVIGEFDDGLTSAAESDSGLIEAEIRTRPPPKRQNVVNPPEMMSSGLSLTDKIDDIFSELTEEIYSADKQQKIIHRAPMRTESTNSSNNARKLSPIRRVNDPLPTPPQLQETSR